MTAPVRAAPRRLGERCPDEEARPTMTAAAVEQLTADLTIVGHPVRMQLLNVLRRSEGRVCVCDLEAAMPVKQPTVSHHLKLLREAGLVEVEREGLWAWYFLDRPALAALRARIHRGLDELVG